MTLNSDELRAYQQAAAYHQDPRGRLLQLLYTHVSEGEVTALEQMTEDERALYALHLAKAKRGHGSCANRRKPDGLLSRAAVQSVPHGLSITKRQVPSG